MPLALAARCALVAAALTPLLAHAQDGYRQPPEPIRSILDAAPTPLVRPSPDRTRLLMLERPSLPSIADVAAPYIPMAGGRLNPRSNFPSRSASFTGMRLLAMRGGGDTRIAVPAGTRLGNPRWSADGSRIAVPMLSDSGSTLAIIDASTGAFTPLSAVRLNGAFGDPCVWRGSSTTTLVCRLIPAARGAAPQPAAAPAGPVVQESFGRRAAERTYQDLLANAYDEARFDYFGTSQVALVSVTGTVTPIGTPALYTSAQPSPDGQQVLVAAMHKPYSYVVPMNRFPLRTAVWTMDGREVKLVHDRQLAAEQSTAFDAVDAGPRGIGWRADAPSTLAWVEALDGGDPARAAEHRDRVVTLAAPFTGAPTQHARVATRARGVTWITASAALVQEYWWKTRMAKTWLINPSAPTQAARLVHEGSAEDAYADPGDPVMTMNANGAAVALTTTDGAHYFRTGTGASPEGDRPFIDRVSLATGTAERLWRSTGAQYEEVIAVMDGRGDQLLTRRETATEPPNFWLRNLRARIAPIQLTRLTDPAPQLAGITSRLVTYTRKDGVQLSATLYLPAGYDAARDGRLPFFLWAYPQEFKTASAAAQVRGSQHRFVRPGGASHLFLLTQGYGVLDGPTMPIVGEGTREPNDTYIEQLVSSAQAAVDKIVDLGVADRDRIGIGGHSYGAFMTANLLAHSNIFRAGIARSGAYNRTLTPFGFQQEERPFWQAQEIYTRMSPFNHADSVKTPILLIHGMNDDNSGTFPIQSERFYAALKGNGATVRYVQLPGEAHGYLARESVGHTLFEMVSWMDQFVKPVRALRPRAE
jgi:dipeptidyl aminopeptidase/acylaminoacyl peptidase